MKYPLTNEAKIEAQKLVENWNKGLIDRHFVWNRETPSNCDLISLSQSGQLARRQLPLAEILLELAKYGLIEIDTYFDSNGKGTRVELLLLQELRNAVENNFAVSEYFLTMNAVGTIIQGNLTLNPGSAIQSVGINQGDLTQTIEDVSHRLIEILGEGILQSNIELRDAINDLRNANTPNQPTKLAKVVNELSSIMQDTANTATIATALVTLTPLIQQILVK